MDKLYNYLERVSLGRRLSRDDKAELQTLFEDIYPTLESHKTPDRFRLASGEIAKGATGRTALNAYLLLLARKSLGKDYIRTDPRLDRWAHHLAFGIMRSNFIHDHPRGVYCCGTCTLSVLPLYLTNAFHWFDCGELADNVLTAFDRSQSVFSRKPSPNYADWAMRFVR